MELFIVTSSISTLVLLAVHVVDFANETHQRLTSDQYYLPPGAAVPTSALNEPAEPVVNYDRAA